MSTYTPHFSTPDDAPARQRATAFSDVVAGVLEGWRLLAQLTVVFVAIAVAIVVFRPTKYDATVTLSPVTAQKSLPLGALGGGLASSMLGGALGGGSGLQASPALIVRLTQMQSVLLTVARERTPDGSTVGERLTGKPVDAQSPAKVMEKLRKILVASYDRESGLVTLSAVYKDSALARVVTTAMVREVTRVFREASRAQATELRRSQSVRLDSAASQLASAEAALQEFLSANRSTPEYSALYGTRQRLERAVQVAQTVYMQVRADRESAVGKELEDTPAVVVLDPLPARLPSEPSGALATVLLSLIAALLLDVVIVFAREMRRDDAGDASSARLRNAVAQLPVVGRRLAATR